MTINFFVGTYTQNSESLGIYNIALDPLTGETTKQTIVETENPSYLEYDEDRRVLYTVNELAEGKGAISSFSYNENNAFQFGSPVRSMGDHPCHILLSKKNELLFVSNYSGGSLAVVKLDESGRPKELQQLISYSGQGPNLPRQSAPHIHSSFLNQTQDLLYVQDLGTDTIYVYHITEEQFLKEAYRIHTKPGGGPRHLAFSKDKRFIFILLELSAEILVYTNDEASVLVQSVSINSEDFEGYNCAAAIRISKDGKYLYATNRGDANCISVFNVNEHNGYLTVVASYDSAGRGPRDFDISLCGRFLIVANQYSNKLIVYGREPETGLLTQKDYSLDVPSPVCVKFY